uniref:CD8 T-cell antigen Ta9 n=1 Tax=Theileria annulata TaxID=5874 RepID=A0A3B0MLR4_THEAN
MNLLTPGIILYSFYLSTCMDSSDSDEDGDGDGDSMLPPHQRSPMFEGTLGGSFSKPYSKEELEGKFPGLKSGKGPKGKGPGKPKPPPGPNKDPMMPTDQEARGASGGPGPYQPGQYPQGQPGPYQTGPYPYPQGQPGPYQTGPYPYPQGQPGPYPVQTPGGYGQPGKGPAYPPDPYGASGGYGPPGHGPAYPPDPYGAAGATGGYGGGASGGDGGPGQPTDPPGPSGPSSGPPTQAPDGTKLGPVDAKTAKNDDHTNVDEFRAGKNNHRHRRITPKHGHGFNFITYDGLRVWVMQGPEYAIEVLLFPLGFGEKTLEIKFSDGSKKIYKKGGNAKPWKEKD